MSDECKEYLLENCPDYRPIGEAPTFGDLEALAQRTNTELKTIMIEEAKKFYSSMYHNDKSKNIYLIQNPALMTYQSFENFDLERLGLPIKNIYRMLPRPYKTGKSIRRVQREQRFNDY